MCGGWRQDKPEPYQLVLIRELAKDIEGKTIVDIAHVGFWGIVCWCCLSHEKVDGTKLPKGTFKGIGIVNIYGWKPLSAALD